MSSPRHVALIGCGFTGTSAFFQLVDRFPVDTITLFEASGRFGPGYPYEPGECRDYLINNTTDTMCLTPSNRRAFLQWLQTQPGYESGVDAKDHLPRSLFGAFLEDVFRSTRTSAVVKGIDVRLITAEATRLREDDDGRVHIGWEDGETAADIAILTTGRCPDIDIYPHPPEGSRTRYIATHVMSDAIDDIPLDATVHVLGASLSAYDVINRLFAPNTGCRFERNATGELVFEPGANERAIVLCSRSGRLKAMQSREPMAIDRHYFTDNGVHAAAAEEGVTLDALARLIRREADAHHARLDWDAVADPYAGCTTAEAVQARAGALLETAIRAATKGGGTDNFLVDFFDDAQITIWDSFASRLLAPDQEKLYRDTFETAVLSYVAACPVSTAERLLALHRAGRLRVVKGVARVDFVDESSCYAIVHELGVESCRVLVNATGQVDRRVTSDRQPALIRDLVAGGLLSPYRRGGIEMNGADVDMASFRARGAKSIYVANMLLWGPGFFTSSAFTMATVVERLLEAAFRE